MHDPSPMILTTFLFIAKPLLGADFDFRLAAYNVFTGILPLPSTTGRTDFAVNSGTLRRLFLQLGEEIQILISIQKWSSM